MRIYPAIAIGLLAVALQSPQTDACPASGWIELSDDLPTCAGWTWDYSVVDQLVVRNECPETMTFETEGCPNCPESGEISDGSEWALDLGYPNEDRLFTLRWSLDGRAGALELEYLHNECSEPGCGYRWANRRDE